MEAMCHTPRERKSKYLDKVRERKTKNKENKERKNEEGTCGKEEGGRKFPTLIKLDQIRWGEEEKGGKEKERKEKKEEGKWSKKLYIFSKIYGD